MQLLAGKPVWFHWIFFVVLSGLIFGISYGLIYLMALRWWVAALSILVSGFIWGTIVFRKAAPGKSDRQDA